MSAGDDVREAERALGFARTVAERLLATDPRAYEARPGEVPGVVTVIAGRGTQKAGATDWQALAARLADATGADVTYVRRSPHGPDGPIGYEIGFDLGPTSPAARPAGPNLIERATASRYGGRRLYEVVTETTVTTVVRKSIVVDADGRRDACIATADHGRRISCETSSGVDQVTTRIVAIEAMPTTGGKT